MTQDWTLSQNKDYRSWVKELKQRYLSACLKASIDANRTLLEYYWSLGRDIADRQYANTYGSKFYETLSHDLRSEMPGEKGFSQRNLRNMYDFYRTYSQTIEILQQPAAESSSSNRPQSADDFIYISHTNLLQGVEDSETANLPQRAEGLYNGNSSNGNLNVRLQVTIKNINFAPVLSLDTTRLMGMP